MASSPYFRSRVVVASCGCGFEKAIPVQAVGIAKATAAATTRSQKHFKLMTDCITTKRRLHPHKMYQLRWHLENPDCGPASVFRAVRIKCKWCDYLSDPCASAGEMAECIDEHEHTLTHQEEKDARRLAAHVAQGIGS